MIEVKDINSSKKKFSTNTNCKASKPKIFLLAKIYTNKREKKTVENSPMFLSKKTMRFVVEKNEDNKKNFHKTKIQMKGDGRKKSMISFWTGLSNMA